MHYQKHQSGSWWASPKWEEGPPLPAQTAAVKSRRQSDAWASLSECRVGQKRQAQRIELQETPAKWWLEGGCHTNYQRQNDGAQHLGEIPLWIGPVDQNFSLGLCFKQVRTYSWGWYRVDVCTLFALPSHVYRLRSRNRILQSIQIK